MIIAYGRAIACAAGHGRADGVERAQAGDESIAGENRADTDVELFPHRLQAMRSFPEMANEVVAGVDQEVGLVDRDHAEASHAADLFRSRIAAMFDAVAVVDARRVAHRRLDSVERHRHGRVALGVDADLPAVAVGACDELFQLLRLPVGRAGELTMRSVWLGEPGGAADEGAVRIELHR